MLKALMLRRSIDAKKAELTELENKDHEFQSREASLESAIAEVEPGNMEQEVAVNSEIEKYEEEKTAHDTAKQTLSADIEKLEGELAEIERNAPKPLVPEVVKNNMRGEMKMENVNIRALPMTRRVFEALPVEQRSAILAQEDTRSFLTQLRSMKGQNRSITGGELTIPVVFLDLIAENMFRYSKLLRRVRVRNVSGQARQTIAGTVPEAVWTEMCGAINELSFVFNQVTLDGYKVAGYVPVCNSILEDNDVNLASWIVEMLSESIGYAMDKAILYGKGAAFKMPLGIVTRLAQQTQPTDYPANAQEWVNLSTSNIQKIGGDDVTGAEFWAQLMQATGQTYNTYARGEMFWAMNSKTYATLKSKVITFTANGDIAANIFGVLPIITGDVDILEFIPDGDIIGGYGDLYLLAQRSGMTIESSYEVQFIQDNTVFRAKQRADGMPIIPQAFVAININNVEVTTSMNFAADIANDAQLTGLTIAGVTLSPSFSGTVYSYNGGTATNNSAKIEATAAQADAKVEIAVNGANVRNGGTAALTAAKANTIAVTVKQGNAVRVYTVTVTGASA